MKITVPRITFVILLFSTTLIFNNCAPATRVTVFQHYPPKPDDYPIKFYRTKLPDCPYEEIGMVSSRQRNKFISMEQVMESLKEKAREMGGDAIIGLAENNESQGSVVSGNVFMMDRDLVLSGTVIKFKETKCRE